MNFKVITLILVFVTVSIAQETFETSHKIGTRPTSDELQTPRVAVAVPLPARVPPKKDKLHRQKRQFVAARPLPAFVPGRVPSTQPAGFNNGGFAAIRPLPAQVNRPRPAGGQFRAFDNNFGRF